MKHINLISCLLLILFAAGGVQKASAVPLSGDYTINSAVVTGGTNYQTFTEFAADIFINGVSGPVVATVAVGSGPYNEQVSFNLIPGVSSTNTVTIEGNGALLQFAAADPFPNIFTLKIASDYMTVNNLHVKALHYNNGSGIYITDNAKHVSITNCMVEVTKTNTISSAFGILVSGATSYLLSGSLSDSLVITGNTVIGGYTGIQLTGEGFTNGSTDSTEKLRDAYVADNIVEDFYATGIWINYTDNAILSGNSISRPTRTTSGSDSQTPAGITISSGSTDFFVEKNKVFDFAAGGGGAFTSIARGVYVNGTTTALTSGTLQNNLIYGLNNNHSAYGMQINSWSGLPINIYHNTIAIDQTVGTTVSPAFPSSGYQTAALNFGGTTTQSNINIKHNIFFVRRDGNVGKRIYYISGAGTTINSDYNVFYFDGLGQGVTDFGYQTTSTQFIDLAAWQVTGQDAHSVFADPQFTDAANGDFLPTNPLITGEILGTSSIGVTDDILNHNRDAQPDPGAYEVIPCGPNPVANFTYEQTGLTFTFTNTTTDALTYHWDFGTGDTSNLQNPSYTFPDTGDYTVTLIAAGNCVSDTLTIDLTITGINDLVGISNFALYPNPTDDMVHLVFNINQAQRMQIELMDVTGRVVVSTSEEFFATGNHKKQLNVQHLSPGIYNVVLRSEKQKASLQMSVIR